MMPDLGMVGVRASWRCFYCGVEVLLEDESDHPEYSTRRASVDHLVPKRHGGRNTRQNLVFACFRCNVRKGAKTVEQYREYLSTHRARTLIPFRRVLDDIEPHCPEQTAIVRRELETLIDALREPEPIVFYGEQGDA